MAGGVSMSSPINFKPTHYPEVVGAINDLRNAASELKRTWTDARDFGFTVEAEDVKGLGELEFE
jgi:hypothetical protein